MKRLVLILFALCLGSRADAFTCSGGVCNTDGSVIDTQNAVDQATPGDEVVIGGTDTTPNNFPREYFWGPIAANQVGTGSSAKIVSLAVTKNIRLRGAHRSGPISVDQGMSDTKISPQSGSGTMSLIHYTCDKTTPDITAEISNLELHGELDFKLWVDGVAKPRLSSGTWVGGMKIHDCKFSTNDAVGNLSTAGGHTLVLQGWVFGVMYRCLVNSDVQRHMGETIIVNHNTSPNDAGNSGDYAWYRPWERPPLQSGAPGSEPTGGRLAGTEHAFFFEDNIYHGCGGYVDTQSGYGGGGLIVVRHCTSWGNYTSHGTRTGGGRQHGPRLYEVYNNINCYETNNPPYDGPKAGAAPWATREGESICYNNFVSNVKNATGPAIPHLRNTFGGSPDYGASQSNAQLQWFSGPDGLSNWDVNERGDTFFLDYFGNTHFIATNYPNYTGLAHKSFDPAQLVAVSDSVQGGRDTNPLWGHVYGFCNPATSPAPTASGNLLTLKIQGVFTGAAANDRLLDNYWKGFVIRNGMIPRDQAPPTDGASPLQAPFSFITKSTYNAQADLTTLTLAPANPLRGNNHPIVDFAAGSNVMLELRKVKTYWCVPGAGSMDTLVANVSPALFVTPPGGISNGNQKLLGVTIWGNMIRTRTNVLSSDPLPSPTPSFATEGTTEYHDALVDDGQTIATPQGFKVLTVPAASVTAAQVSPYPWNPNTTAGVANPQTRIGADWAGSFLNANSNIVHTNLPGKIWESFYSQGSGGFVYPHPLHGAAVAQPEVVSVSTGSATVVGGNTATISVVDTAPAAASINVAYTFAGSGANPAVGGGTDFDAPTPATGSLIIAAGESGADVTVVTHARPGQINKTATFTITGITTSGSATFDDKAATQILTITNTPTMTVAASAATVLEGNVVNFVITSSGNVSANTSVNFALSGAASNNYCLGSGCPTTPTTSPVTIPAGQSSVTIPLNTISLSGNQGNRSVVMTLNTGTGYNVGAPPNDSASVTINDTGAGATPTPATIKITP